MIVGAGAIAPLVTCLGSSSEGVQAQAAGALLTLLAGSEGRKAAMVAAGAIPALTACSASSCAVVRERASRALRNLSVGSREHGHAVRAVACSSDCT